MGVYTYQNFKDRLKMELGERAALSSPTDWYGHFVNLSYLQLCTRKRIFGINKNLWFPELETSSSATTSDGVAYVSVPATCQIVRGIWDTTNDAMLKWMPYMQYWDAKGRANTSSEGIPTKYTRLGTYLYLLPTPNSSSISLTIYFKKRPTLLSAASDTTVLKDEWDEPLLKLATINALMKLKEYDFAKIERDNLVEDVTGLIDAIYDEQKQLDQHVQPDMFYLRRS